MTSSPANVREWIALLHQVAADIAQNMLVSRGEVTPFIAVASPSSQPPATADIALIMIGHLLDGSSAGKNKAAALFQDIATQPRVEAVAMASEVWLSFDKSTRPSMDPKRQEGLLIELVAKGEQAHSMSIFSRVNGKIELAAGSLEFSADKPDEPWFSRFLPPLGGNAPRH